MKGERDEGHGYFIVCRSPAQNKRDKIVVIEDPMGYEADKFPICHC